jgi:hypothetical protein
MQYRVTQSEIIRFLVKTDGHIVTAGKDANVYGASPTAAYTIPSSMLKEMIDGQIVAVVHTPTGNRHYSLTDKGLRLGSQVRG